MRPISPTAGFNSSGRSGLPLIDNLSWNKKTVICAVGIAYVVGAGVVVVAIGVGAALNDDFYRGQNEGRDLVVVSIDQYRTFTHRRAPLADQSYPLAIEFGAAQLLQNQLVARETAGTGSIGTANFADRPVQRGRYRGGVGADVMTVQAQA